MSSPSVVEIPAALCPEWLSEVLAAGGSRARVSSFTCKPVGTGQMADSFRVRLEYAERDAGAPDSLVIKAPAADPTSRASGAQGGAYAKEVRFYRDLAPRLAIRTPACWFAEASPDGTLFNLVLEDLAPAEQGDQIAGCSAEQAAVALENLAGLHGPVWCDRSLEQLDWLSPWTPEISAMLGQILVAATDAFIARYAGRLPEQDAEVLRRFAAACGPWSQSKAERFAPVHGDYRLDNLLFATPAGGSPCAAVDWQTVSLANPGRDTGYFLGNAMEPAERRRHERELLRVYLEALRKHGVEGYSEEDCFEDYRSGLFQGPLVTVLGAMAVEVTERGDAMFMAMATRACQAIRDHDALALL